MAKWRELGVATAGRCKMGKRSAANTVANPMLAADHLQGLVLEDVGDAHSAAAERAMQMVRDRHEKEGKRPPSESHLYDIALDTALAKHAAEDSPVLDPYEPESVTNTAKARAKFASFVKESMLERVVFGTRDPEAEAELLKALWKGEAEHQVEHPGGLWTGLLYPESELRMVYDLFQLSAVLYTSYVVPLRLAFDETPVVGTGPFYFDLVIDLFFIFDIFVSFHAYTRDTHSGRLETNPKALRWNYFTGFFAIDFVACFPFDYIMLMTNRLEEAEGARNLRLLRLMRISRSLRLARLLRLFRGSRMATLYDFVQMRVVTHMGYKLAFEISAMTMLIFTVSHIIGCLWLHTGIVNAGELPHGSWMDHRGWYKPDSVCSPDYDSNPQEGLDTITRASDDPLFDVYKECLDTTRISHGHMYM